MYNSDDFRGIIQKFLSDLNLSDVTTKEHWQNTDKWMSWYHGDVDDFHNYTIYNGKTEVPMRRKTLQMAKMICEDWADLLMNEKVKIMVDDEKLTEIMEKNLLNNNFYVQSNQLIEKAFALGEGAFVEYKTGNPIKPVEINYCNAKMIYPIRVINGEILDCAFCWLLSEEVYFATVHLQQPDGSYRIFNKVFKENKDENNIEYLKLPANVVEETHSAIKLFQIIKPNMANNIDIDSSRGLSVYANSIDKLEDVDLKFDSYHQEFNLGRKRTLVNSSVSTFNVDESGSIKPIFDSKDIVFYQMDMGEQNDPIKTLESQLRIEEHDRGLQTSLNLLSDSVGLGMDHYVFRDGKVYTNQSQIISSNSKMFRRIKKHELILEEALISLVKALIYLETSVITDKDISIDFDDSIIEDKAEKQRQAQMEYNAGLIDEVQYFMQTRNMDESTAQAFYDRIKKRKPIEEEQEPEGID